MFREGLTQSLDKYLYVPGWQIDFGGTSLLIKLRRISFAGALIVSTSVSALPKYVVQPVPLGAETVRYNQGTPTLDLRLSSGAAQITPLEFDHGSMSFSVAIWSNASQPVNFGVENILVQTEGRGLAVFTKDQLVGKAENRAMWTQIGLAALGGLAAVSAANQQRSVNSTIRGPQGTTYVRTTYNDSSDELRAAATLAGTGVAVAAIQRRLDQTRAALGDQIVQTTTVDPYDSYAGRIVVEKIKNMKLPQEVRITLNWNGQDYPFAFRVAKFGAAPPAFIPLTTARVMNDTSIRPAAIEPSSSNAVPSATIAQPILASGGETSEKTSLLPVAAESSSTKSDPWVATPK